MAPETWDRLAGARVSTEALWARRAAPDVTDRLLAALDAEGKRHLLVLLQASEADLRDDASRGLTVVTREMAIPGHDSGRYLDVACVDPAGHAAFDLIAGELAARLAAGSETATECTSRVLGKWRRFWGQIPRRLLSRDEQLGLFAELWFLSTWMAPTIGASAALGRWRGPFGARHDFEWPGESVEVKATGATRGRIHHINGADQLLPPEAGSLLLFSLILREEAGATNSIVSLISSFGGSVENDADALSRFESSLAQLGYSPAHADEYVRLKLRVVSEAVFRVDDGFPRVIPDTFRGGIPAGVEHVEYDINLSGFEHLQIASRPSDISWMQLCRQDN